MPARRTLSHGKAMEVAAMSLSAREEQILGSIQDGLAGSDPKLTWMMATFTRLASGEDMPMREKIHAVRLVANLRDRRPPCRDVGRRRARRLCRRLDLPQYWVLWLAAVVAVALVAIALTVGRGGSGGGGGGSSSSSSSSSSSRGSCATSWSAVCIAEVPAHPSVSEADKAASDQSSRAG